MKKGFTLIELLAVIVILAIVALIATPLILNVIDDSKKGTFKNSAYGIIEAAELNYAQNMLSGVKEEKSYVYEDSKQINPENTVLEFKGNKPKNGIVKTSSNGKVAMAIYDGKYCAIKGYDDSEITISETEQEDCIVLTLPNSDKMCDEDYTDPRDGNVYKTVKIGNQCWMAEDLRYTGNGCLEKVWDSTAPHDACTRTSETELQNNPTRREWLEKTVWYQWPLAIDWDGTNPSNPEEFDGMERRQGICPDGWAVPSLVDFGTLRIFANPNNATKLKAKSPFWNGTDDFGFNGLPVGNRNGNKTLSSLGSSGMWWAVFYYDSSPGTLLLDGNDSKAYTGGLWVQYGAAVRCVLAQ